MVFRKAVPWALLFLVYMNTLQYADYTTLICSGSNPASAAVSMNYQLQLIHLWIVDSKIKLNT